MLAPRPGGDAVIVTLTANPSVDRTIEVAGLRRGGVLRALSARVDAGGKGINVARALSANGHRSVAVLPTGGAEGDQLVGLLARSGLHFVAVPVRGAVRANVTVVEPDGTTTKLNEPGPVLAEPEVASLAAALLAAARPEARWAVLCGSLPPGVPVRFYRDLVDQLHAAGVRVAVDTSGSAFRAALAARPDLVKPNREELAEAAGRPVDTLGDVASAGALLCDAGAGAVLASLGPDGAMLVTPAGCWLATGPVREPRSTVGAGDALLAGYLSVAARDAVPAGALAVPSTADSPPGTSTVEGAALVEAVAYGTAAISLPGSRMPEPADLDRTLVTLHATYDPARALTH
jgi:1-phosphofructokinase